MTRFVIIALLAGCTSFEPIARNTCGNGLLEPGEDCDSNDPRCVRCAVLCASNADCPTSDYTCGGATTDASFEYTYGGSETIVAECYCRWPVDSGGADPGFWSYTGAEEIDYFEGWGWNSPSWAAAEAGVPVITTPYRAHEIYPLVLGLGFDPSLAFHRYATEITPNDSAFLVREYIDGVFRWSFEAPVAKSQDGLILTGGLRVNGQSDDFVVRSIELYQDGAHAGQGIRGGGIAPGTTLK